MARVDPHLIFGAKIILDVDGSLLNEFAAVQHKFLQQTLSLSQRSMMIPLLDDDPIVECGIWPIRYHRLIVAVTYLQYLITIPELLL